MEDKFLIHVNIQGRKYPVNIARGDKAKEASIRKAANNINELILQLKKKGFKDRDDQDYISMVALQLAVKASGSGEESDTLPMLNKIRNLDRIIEEVLEKE